MAGRTVEGAMSSHRTPIDRVSHHPPLDWLRWIVRLLIAAVALRLLVSWEAAPEVYDPVPPRTAAGPLSPEQREVAFPARLSEELWLGMKIADAEAIVRQRMYWNLQLDRVQLWRISPRERFPKLPEAMTWYSIDREGTAAGIDLGVSDGIVVYKRTHGTKDEVQTDIFETVPEYQSPPTPE